MLIITSLVRSFLLGPGVSDSRMIAGRTAEAVNFYSLDGKLVKSFDRVFGDGPTVNYDLESILKGLKTKPNSWLNSPVRDAIEDALGKINTAKHR